MKNTTYLNLSASFLFTIFLFIGLVFSQNAVAANNVYGFGWSGMTNDEAIGWISFNDAETTDANGGYVPGGGGDVDYGVNIDEDGNISGYAWAAVNPGEGLGWISFNESDVSGCPNGGSKPKVNPAPDGDGRYQLSGWARVMFADGTSNSGGWSGCISLRGTNYGVYIDDEGNFHGFAWSDMVIGWINFNSADCDGTNCPAGPVNYKVYTTARFAPIAKIGCGGSCSGGNCEPDNDASVWRLFPYAGECPDCMYEFQNNSTGKIECTKWTLTEKATGKKHNYKRSGKMNAYLSDFEPSVAPGMYKLELTVSDAAINNADCTEGHFDTDNHDTVDIRRELDANFEFTFDNPYVAPTDPPTPVNWQANDDDGKFAKRLVKGQKIYLRDASVKSDFAGNIVESKWKINDVDIVADASGYVSFTALKSNTIRLDAYDDNVDNYSARPVGRHNCIIESGKSKALPEWKEVIPVGTVWSYIFAAISEIFTVK